VILLNHGRRRVMLDEEEGGSKMASAASYRFLTFRMVRQGKVKLRDVRVKMQAQFWLPGDSAFGDRDHHKGRVVSLSLEQDYFTTLEQLQVWHRVDESSPLWRLRDDIGEHLDGVEVSVSAFDTSSLQQVMFFKRYERSELKLDAVFENTLSASGRNSSQLQADHSKLDQVTAEESPDAMQPARGVRKRSLSGVHMVPRACLNSIYGSFKKSNGSPSESLSGSFKKNKSSSSPRSLNESLNTSFVAGSQCSCVPNEMGQRRSSPSLPATLRFSDDTCGSDNSAGKPTLQQV